MTSRYTVIKGTYQIVFVLFLIAIKVRFIKSVLKFICCSGRSRMAHVYALGASPGVGDFSHPRGTVPGRAGPMARREGVVAAAPNAADEELSLSPSSTRTLAKLRLVRARFPARSGA